MIVTNRPASALPRALRLVLQGGLVASLALGLVYCSEQASQASPTALEVPSMARGQDARKPVHLGIADRRQSKPSVVERRRITERLAREERRRITERLARENPG